MNEELEVKEKWICILGDEAKGFVKGKIVSITVYSFYESYSSTPYPDVYDEYRTPPFAPESKYLTEWLFDDENRTYLREDLNCNFQRLSERRREVIKKLLES